MSKGNKMLINRIAVIGLSVVAAATQAGVPPVKFFYRDTVPVSITCNESRFKFLKIAFLPFFCAL